MITKQWVSCKARGRPGKQRQGGYGKAVAYYGVEYSFNLLSLYP